MGHSKQSAADPLGSAAHFRKTKSKKLGWRRLSRRHRSSFAIGALLARTIGLANRLLWHQLAIPEKIACDHRSDRTHHGQRQGKMPERWL